VVPVLDLASSPPLTSHRWAVCVHLRVFNPLHAEVSLSHAHSEIKGKASEMAKEVGVNMAKQIINQPCSAEMIFPGLQAT